MLLTNVSPGPFVSVQSSELPTDVLVMTSASILCFEIKGRAEVPKNWHWLLAIFSPKDN